MMAADRPPLLFVHGAFHGAWCWAEHWLPYFTERGWDCTAFSLRGHPPHPGTVRGARIRDYVADLIAAARELPAPPIVIGHSMGGFIVQHYLAAGHRAHAAALIASVPWRGAAGYVLRETLRDPLGIAAQMLRLRVTGPIATVEATRRHFFAPDLPNADAARYHARLIPESALAVLDLAGLALPNAAAIRDRHLPILVLAAERDAIFTVAEERSTAEAYRAAFHVVPGAHDVMLDSGWQTAAAVVADWLATV